MSDVEHSKRAHSTLGASSTYRWWPCPGSNALIESLNVPDVPTVYMLEGTAAHELAHMCLLNGQDAIEYTGRVVDGFDVTDEMASAVQVYLDECRSHIRPGVETFTEKKFNLRDLDPPKPMFGTADFVAVDTITGEVTIVDLKYGVGWVVAAEKNPQLMYYALGVLCAFKTHRIKKINAVIVQPRARAGDPIKRAVFTPSELFVWQAELMEHARATLDPNAPLVAGPHCKYCGARGRCQAEADAAFEAAQMEWSVKVPDEIIPPKLPPTKDELRVLTPEQLGYIYNNLPILKSFIKAVEDTIREVVERGIEGTGLKAVRNPGDRHWTNKEETAEKLTSLLGLGKEETQETKLISPATAEKLAVAKLRDLGMKKKDAEPMVKGLLKQITVRPDDRPLIVPLTDERPALPARGDEFECKPLPANIEIVEN